MDTLRSSNLLSLKPDEAVAISWPASGLGWAAEPIEGCENMTDNARDDSCRKADAHGASGASSVELIHRQTRWVRSSALLARRPAAVDHVLAGLLAAAWMSIAPAHFPPEKTLTFGFTPTYTEIAEASLASGRYSGRSTGVVGSNDRIGDEVQREPLYSAALVAMVKVGRSCLARLPYQRLAVAFTLYLWGLFAARNFGRAVMAAMFLLEIYAPASGFYVAVLYPYAFQFLLITCGTLATIRSLQTGRWHWFGVAGIVQRLACHERGAYLLLPLATGSAAVLLPLGGRRYVFHSIIMVVAAAVVSPWLRRSSRYGRSGADGMLGCA
jgi:hypothetical protein